MRIALLGEPGGLADALRAAGHDAVVVRPPGVAPIDALLARRGFTGPLTPIPLALRTLLAGGFDVAHAFTVPDAAAGLLWRRRAGGRVVFTCSETLDRATVADRRLRLRLLTDALERSDAVVAGSTAARDALLRWMAIDAPVLEPADAEGYVRLYAGST